MLDAVAVAETVGAVAGAETVVDGDADVVVEVDVVVVDVVVVPGVVAVLDSPGNGWKKTTRSNDGPFAGQPPPVPVELAPTAAPAGPAVSGLVASASVTRVTPLISLRFDINRATSSCVVVQPLSSNAGAAIALRSVPVPIAEPPVLPPAPLMPALGETVPSSDCSEVLEGTTFERSDSAACQSKRWVAIWLTVASRLEASLTKLA